MVLISHQCLHLDKQRTDNQEIETFIFSFPCAFIFLSCLLNYKEIKLKKGEKREKGKKKSAAQDLL